MSDEYIREDQYTDRSGKDTPLWLEMLAKHSFLDLGAYGRSDVPDIAKSLFRVAQGDAATDDDADRSVVSKGESTMGVGITLRSLADVRERPGKSTMSLSLICREIARMRDMMGFLHAAMRTFATEEDIDATGPAVLGGDVHSAPEMRRRLNEAIIRRDGAQQARIAAAMLFARSVSRVADSMRESLREGGMMMAKMLEDYRNGEDLDGTLKIGDDEE